MYNEDVFQNFRNVRLAYLKLIEILNNQTFKTIDIIDSEKQFKRIKINNSIMTILDAIERLNLNSLKENEMQEIIQCFQQGNINLSEFRNCLAHAHYEVADDFNSITFKKNEFFLEISEEELQSLADKISEIISNKVNGQELQFNGKKLNRFLDDLIEKKDTIIATPEIYATLLQSYNIYHAFLYEKLLQQQEQKKFAPYYENRIIINSNLPYINQDFKKKVDEISFETLQFEDLTEQSKNDLLYLLLTSEYGEEALREFEGNLEGSNKGDIINFMLAKLPKIGRIVGKNIMPMKKDLLHGFYRRKNRNSFIYPPFQELVIGGTKKELIEQYIKEDEEISKQFTSLEITEEKIITKPEILCYLLGNMEKLGDDIKRSENMQLFFQKLKCLQEKRPQSKPGEIYGKAIRDTDKNLKKEINCFVQNIPNKYKIWFAAEKAHSLMSEHNIVSAYKNILYILRMQPNDNKFFEIKCLLEKCLRRSIEEKNDDAIEDTNKDTIKLIELGKIFDLYQKIATGRDADKYVDFTNLIKHIRDSAVHALTEVDYTPVGKMKKHFTVKNTEDIPSREKQTKINLDEIKFNFQDYDSAKGETSFLLMDIPASKVVSLIEMQSEYLLIKILSKDNKVLPKGKDDDENDR